MTTGSVDSTLGVQTSTPSSSCCRMRVAVASSLVLASLVLLLGVQSANKEILSFSSLTISATYPDATGLAVSSSTAKPANASVSIETDAMRLSSALVGSGQNQVQIDQPLELHSKLVRHESLPHPSCLAEHHLGKQQSTSQVVHPPSGSDNRWLVGKHYAKPEWNCFKHGGHRPGYRRAGIDGKGGDYLTLENVVYYQGVFFLTSRSALTGADGSKIHSPLRFSGYFSMVSGNWPQLVTTEFPFSEWEKLPRHIKEAVERRAARDEHRGSPGGNTNAPNVPESSLLNQEGQSPPHSLSVLNHVYFQPPTDYMSHYHVVVEVVLPAFHRLWKEGFHRRLGKSDPPSSQWPYVITGRPSHTKHGFKKKACALIHERCLDTHWGRMFQALMHQQPGNSSYPDLPSIIGLRAQDPQLAYVADMTSKVRQQLLKTATQNGGVGGPPGRSTFPALFIRKLFIGNPTHCEPLWGPDPYYAETAGASVKQTQSFIECQEVLAAFRQFYLSWAYQSPTLDGADRDRKLLQESKYDSPITVRADPIEIVWTSREGDWARWVVNEADVVEAMRKHLRSRYPPGNALGYRLGEDATRLVKSGVRVLKLQNGTLESQLRLINQRTTIFIGNHGANLIPSLYLRPNAAVITLSLSHPGFYPFSVFPSWLHWRDMVIEQECNRRLWKKCKWSDPQNNDMKVSEEQLSRLLRFIDELLVAQASGKPLQLP